MTGWGENVRHGQPLWLEIAGGLGVNVYSPLLKAEVAPRFTKDFPLTAIQPFSLVKTLYPCKPMRESRGEKPRAGDIRNRCGVGGVSFLFVERRSTIYCAGIIPVSFSL
jgi:hypothetical protein